MKDLKDTLNEQLNEQLGPVNENPNKLSAGKTFKFSQGNTETVDINIPGGKKIFVTYDDNTGEMTVISTDNIIEYLDYYGVPEQESIRIDALDVDDIWLDKLRTPWIRIQ